jgi:hypothetical protein
MNSKVNVITLYWVGDFRNRDFTPRDVDRLYFTVEKHIDRPFDFYVLTNDMKADVPGTKIELLHGDDWPGWWSKMELHRPDLPAGRTLYLDLDSHVIRSLAPILDYDGDLVMFGARSNAKKQDPTIVHRYQAATMLFTPGKMTWLYEKFLQDWDYYVTHYRSDQDVMGDWVPALPTFPDKWLLKLGDVHKNRAKYRNAPPEDTIIVTGQPKSGLFRRTYEIKWLEKMAR